MHIRFVAHMLQYTSIGPITTSADEMVGTNIKEYIISLRIPDL